MIRIILCDDDPVFLNELNRQVQAHLNCSGKVHCFTAMEQIPDSILSGCDIALLDADFAGKRYSGIDIARKLRQFRPDAVILFVTNYIEYAPEGYEVNAFRYLLKSAVRDKLAGYLREAVAEVRSHRASLKLQIGGEWIDVLLSEILYMESDRHTVTVHTVRKCYTYYNSLTALEEELSDHGFLRIQKSILVNMAHLKKFTSQGAVLSDGTAVRVSELNYRENKKRFLLWKGI